MIYRTFIAAVFLVFAQGCSDSNNDSEHATTTTSLSVAMFIQRVA